MLVAKLLFNSVVSTPKVRFMTMDISNFYLMTTLKRPDYIRMKLSKIPSEVIKKYRLRDITTPDGSVYIEATKGMYGLPHEGLLANELLKNASARMSTVKASWYLDYGSTTGDRYNLRSWSKISASNMLGRSTPGTFSTHWNNTTKSPRTGQAPGTSGSLSIGTTTNNRYTY